MEIKLKDKRTLKVKDLSIDERDELLDSVDYDNSDDGVKIKMVHSTMTKFIRLGVKNSDDKFIKSLNFADKTEIFQLIQGDLLNLGEEEASD